MNVNKFPRPLNFGLENKHSSEHTRAKCVNTFQSMDRSELSTKNFKDVYSTGRQP